MYPYCKVLPLCFIKEIEGSCISHLAKKLNLNWSLYTDTERKYTVKWSADDELRSLTSWGEKLYYTYTNQRSKVMFNLFFVSSTLIRFSNWISPSRTFQLPKPLSFFISCIIFISVSDLKLGQCFEGGCSYCWVNMFYETDHMIVI